MIIIVKNAANRQGHMSLLLKVKGNFDRAYIYAKSIKKNKPKYNVTTYNCADVSIDVLLASMKYRHKGLDNSKTYALKQTRKIIRPNEMVGSLKKHFWFFEV